MPAAGVLSVCASFMGLADMLENFVHDCYARYGAHTSKMVEAMIRLFREEPDTDIDIYANPDGTTRIRVGAPMNALRHPENTQVLNLQMENHLGPGWLYNALVTVRDEIIKDCQKSMRRDRNKPLEPHEFRVKPVYVTCTLPDGKEGRMTFEPQKDITPYEFHCCAQLMAGNIEGNKLAYATSVGVLHHFHVEEIDYFIDHLKHTKVSPTPYNELPYGSKYEAPRTFYEWKEEHLRAYLDSKTNMLMPGATPWIKDKPPAKK